MNFNDEEFRKSEARNQKVWNQSAEGRQVIGFILFTFQTAAASKKIHLVRSTDKRFPMEIMLT